MLLNWFPVERESVILCYLYFYSNHFLYKYYFERKHGTSIWRIFRCCICFIMLRFINAMAPIFYDLLYLFSFFFFFIFKWRYMYQKCRFYISTIFGWRVCVCCHTVRKKCVNFNLKYAGLKQMIGKRLHVNLFRIYVSWTHYMIAYNPNVLLLFTRKSKRERRGGERNTYVCIHVWVWYTLRKQFTGAEKMLYSSFFLSVCCKYMCALLRDRLNIPFYIKNHAYIHTNTNFILFWCSGFYTFVRCYRK